MSLTARVRNRGNLVQSNVYSVFAGDLAAARIIRVSIIASCPQRNSCIYIFQQEMISCVNGVM